MSVIGAGEWVERTKCCTNIRCRSCSGPCARVRGYEEDPLAMTMAAQILNALAQKCGYYVTT